MNKEDYDIWGIKIPRKTGDRIMGVAVICVIAFFPLRSFFGTKTLGSFFQRSRYSVQYYVYLQSPDDQAKSYKVKADITKDTWSYDSGDDGGSTSGGNIYSLDKVYWPDGGYSEFQDCDLVSLIESNKKASCSTVGDNVTYQISLAEKIQ